MSFFFFNIVRSSFLDLLTCSHLSHCSQYFALRFLVLFIFFYAYNCSGAGVMLGIKPKLGSCRASALPPYYISFYKNFLCFTLFISCFILIYFLEFLTYEWNKTVLFFWLFIYHNILDIHTWFHVSIELFFLRLLLNSTFPIRYPISDQ